MPSIVVFSTLRFMDGTPEKTGCVKDRRIAFFRGSKGVSENVNSLFLKSIFQCANWIRLAPIMPSSAVQ